MALTFDDGPDPVYTPPLLDILSRHGAKATFFMVGDRARAHRGIIETILERGHVVGNHTMDHPSLPTLSGRERRSQIRACRRVLGPRAASFLRPPFGHQTHGSRFDAWLLRYDVVGWGSHVEDWLSQPAHIFSARIRETFRPGRIVLLHDGICGGVDPGAEDRGPMLEGLDLALSDAPEFEFVTIPELLRRGQGRRTYWVATAGQAQDG